MGMLHEQSRPDRDNFLIINWNNIQPNFHSQVKDQNHKNTLCYRRFWAITNIIFLRSFSKYEMMSSNTFVDTGDDLDIWSVMMYPWYGFLTTEASQVSYHINFNAVGRDSFYSQHVPK